MEQNPPYVIAAGSHGAELFRRALSSLIPVNGGTVKSGDLVVTQNGTPNMSVNIAVGEIWVPGTTNTASQGLYYCYNDATVNKPISASDPSKPRIDVVIAQVRDSAYAGSDDDWRLTVVTGTPTTGADLTNLNGRGTLPDSSLALSNVLVPAAASSIVTADISAPLSALWGAPVIRSSPALGTAYQPNPYRKTWAVANLSGAVSSGIAFLEIGPTNPPGQIVDSLPLGSGDNGTVKGIVPPGWFYRAVFAPTATLQLLESTL